MHNKTRLSILLIFIILLFSCKTAEKTAEQPPEEKPEDQTEELSQGAVLQEESESGPELMSPEDSESSIITDPIEDSVLETEIELELEWEEEQNEVLVEESRTLKKIPPRGGRKLTPEVIDTEEAIAPLETEPSKIIVLEDLENEKEEPIVIKESDIEIEESLIEQEASIESTEKILEIENKLDTPVEIIIIEDLPSENDELPSNPLLPLVIKVEEDVLEVEDIVIESPVSISEEPDAEIFIVVEEESPIPEPETIVDNKDMNEDEYSLSTDSSGKLIVHLQGAGWVFLSSSGNSELKLRDKSYEPSSGRTRFAFTVKNNGDYDAELVFMKQDLLKGESEQKVLSIDKNSLETETTVNNDTIVDKESSSDSTSDSTELESEATETDTLFAVPEDSLDSDPIENTEEGEITADSSDNEIVLKPVDLDKLNASELYDMARIYEKPGSQQSLETAMDLYIKIKEDFPVTEERFMAEARIRYLNKHYFKVQ